MLPAVQLARLLQALPLSSGAAAMVVGCGSGYSAAIMARLAGHVVAIEEDESLLMLARDRLRGTDTENVALIPAPLVRGHPDAGPYDAILLEGTVELEPDTLLAQLSLEGALATIGRHEGISRAILYERIEGGVTKWPLFETWASPLPGFQRKPEFVF
jgi:protein-L-isoaspartate(D-aspartate) O-methyltransferase